MKIKCKKCGAVVDSDENSICPKCFEVLNDEEYDFEVIEDEESDEDEVEENQSLEDDSKNQIKSIVSKMFWIVLIVFIIIAVAFTIVQSSGNSGYKNLLNTIANTYEAGKTDDYISVLPDEYIDYKVEKFGSLDEYKNYLSKQLNTSVLDYSNRVGEDYKVSFSIVSSAKYNSDDIKAQLNLLPYKLIEVDEIQDVEVMFEFKGNKTLKYRKNLLIGRIKDKWYLLNADNQ